MSVGQQVEPSSLMQAQAQDVADNQVSKLATPFFWQRQSSLRVDASKKSGGANA
jgi:hypothetical protein